MFLRNLARSLSFSSGNDRRRQSQQQPRPPSTKSQALNQPPSSKLPVTEVPNPAPVQVQVPVSAGVTTLKSSFREPSTSTTTNHKAHTTDTPILTQSHSPRSSACSTSPSNFEINNVQNKHSSQSVICVGTSELNIHSSRQINSLPSTRHTAYTSTAGGTASILGPAVTEVGLKPGLILNPADHNSAETSNFPGHLLHFRTISSPASNEEGDNSFTAPTSFHPEISSSNTQLITYSDERETVMQRRVWVKRPGASATRVEVNEDDLVDNVRDVILRKYANSLGRHIDSPDITLKITAREQANKNVPSERVLGPEESIGRTLDTYYPGGQTIDEALIIDVPQKRTPKPSPRPGNHHIPYYGPEDYRPGDGARDYFPPMPLHSPHIQHIPHPTVPNGTLPVHSMSILTTGQPPALPSPGGHRTVRHVRPKYPRQHTSSPTVMHAQSSNTIDGKSQINGATIPSQPLPTPPPTVGDKNTAILPNRTTSPYPSKLKKKRPGGANRDTNGEPPLPSKPASAGLLDGRVPPINVLLVEDNVINLKLLEQFMKRLKVRWKSAMNGREAVNMWRKGGFHLVLMDIQLPVMNGLEATKEIRRLESVNGIGLSVFGENGEKNTNGNNQLSAEDKLEDRKLFKSPVIIVALTASSLQSDRHEALAVGCNDFLTKPVNFVWMERKVTEWGCMQALIDFDGWRRWKEIAEKKASEDPEKRKQEEKEEKAKARAALKAQFAQGPPSSRSNGTSETVTKKDDKPVTKKDERPVTGSSNNTGSTSTNSTDVPPSRRSHKGSRSQSGGIGTVLSTTLEVDEKET